MVCDFTTKPELKVFFLNNTLKVAITARVVSCGFELWSDLEVLKEKLKVCTSVPTLDDLYQVPSADMSSACSEY